MKIPRFSAKLTGGLLAAIVIFGCSGGGGTNVGQGTISGTVTDTNGNVVRDAKVTYIGNPDRTTFTNSSGSFILEGPEEGIAKLQASLSVNGVSYFGENFTEVFGNERTKSVNIVVGPANTECRLKGQVTDRFGAPLEGARVHANSNYLGSSYSITDADGNYSMRGLFPGIDYDVVASGRGYVSDNDVIRMTSKQTLTRNYVLSDAGSPTLPAPNNLSVVIWTSPRVATNAPGAGSVKQLGSVKDAIRKILDKKRGTLHRGMPKKQSLNSQGNNPIESDLFWDTYRDDNLLGFGIYRGTSQTGATTGIEYLADPIANFFADADRRLVENQNYYYEITALNTLYPDTANSESDFSNRYGVRAIGDMTLQSPFNSPLTFRWNTCRGAEEYTVYLFADEPTLGVDVFWPTTQSEIDQATTTGNSLVYTGPTLTRGQRYWYVVLATANANDSRSISVVSSFVAP